MDNNEEKERFNFDCAASWEAAARLLGYCVHENTDGVSVSAGVDVLHELWKKNKASLLKALDENTGRVELTVSLEEATCIIDNTLLTTNINPYRFVYDYVQLRWDDVPLPKGALEEALLREEATHQACLEKWLGYPHFSDVPIRDLVKEQLKSHRWLVNICPAIARIFSPEKSPALEVDEHGNWCGTAVTAKEIMQYRLLSPRKDLRPNREGKEFQVGTKLGKYIAAVAEYMFGCSKEETKLILDAASLLASELKPLEVTVVLSVNPLDILLASAHTTGWRSCHHIEDGEWCTGPLSYLVDGATAIAYAYISWGYNGVTDLWLPRKMWRQMVYFDLEHASCILSRQYPNHVPLLEAKARRLAAYAIAKFLGVEKPRWKFRTIDPDSHSWVTCADEENEGIGNPARHHYFVYHNSEWHYHDYASSGLRLCCEEVEGTPAAPKVGLPKIPCVTCGSMREESMFHDKLECYSCGEYGVCCACCGELFASDYDDDNVYHGPDGECLCEECFCNDCTHCHACGEVIYIDDACVGPDGECYCNDCFDARFVRCDICDDVMYESRAVELNGEFYCQTCFEENFSECSSCGEYYDNDYIITFSSPYVEGSYCKDCFHEEILECAWCGEFVDRDTAVEVCAGTGTGEWCCPGCAEECETGACGELLVEDPSKCEWCRRAPCEEEGEEAEESCEVA